jgi:uncharacterized membrane protein YeaQ/YmgE (transglycosylase-associated protein family)
MWNHLFNGSIGGSICWIMLQTDDQIGTVVKAIAALVLGLIGTLLSNWVTRKFPTK